MRRARGFRLSLLAMSHSSCASGWLRWYRIRDWKTAYNDSRRPRGLIETWVGARLSQLADWLWRWGMPPSPRTVESPETRRRAKSSHRDGATGPPTRKSVGVGTRPYARVYGHTHLKGLGDIHLLVRQQCPGGDAVDVVAMTTGRDVLDQLAHQN